jgi:ADP-ribose pyrophosphatase
MSRKAETVYRGRTIQVSLEDAALPNGRTVPLEVVRHPGAAAAVPFASADEVVLIRQFRYATGGSIYEVPAGKLDPGEDPAHCAARELEEETGLRAGRIERLGEIWTSPGFCDERIHLFAAFDLVAGPARPADDEVIEVIPMPLERALELIFEGELTDAKSVVALLHAARHLGRLG